MDAMPRTAEQWSRMREASRSKIVSSAVQVFGQKGFHAASMEHIARRAGVSKGLAYNYFRSKEELFATTVEEWLIELERLWASVEDLGDPQQKIRRLLDNFSDAVARNPETYRLYLTAFMQLDFPGSVERAARRSQSLRQAVDRIRRASRSLFAALGFSDPDAEVAYFSLLTTGLAAEWIMDPQRYPLKKMKQRILAYYACRPRNQT